MIIHSTLHKIVALCFRIGADPLDSDETRLNKAMLVNASFMFIAAGLIWGAAYILLGEPLAGVIGHKKFQYDVWGDTVNIASRMESQGEPGKIQITQTTYELIKDDFVCEPKGQVVIKGKGLMETWNLVGSKG